MRDRASHPQWLATTVAAVREVMAKRLERRSLEPDEQKEVEMALEELEVMWEEMQGQATLLERESARYTEFFEHSPEAYLITDVGGNVREANHAARELFSGDPTGRALASLVPEAERAHFLAVFLGAAERPEPLSWQGAIGAARVQISVRAIPLRRSGVAGLCWLLRPLD